VTHSVVPCSRQAILRIAGYSDSNSVVRVDNRSGVMPADDNSAEQPFVMF